MTDVEKIRKEVERLQNELIQEKERGHGSDIDDACILELQNVLTYIDLLQKEFVNEDLEEAAKHYLYNNILYDDVYVGNPTDKDCIEMFKAGAQWQKEQMMAKAIDANCFGFQDDALFSFRLPADKYLVGSKVKIIVITEDIDN